MRRATRGVSLGRLPHFSSLDSPPAHVYQSKHFISLLLSHTSASPRPQALSFDIHPPNIGGRVGYPPSQHPLPVLALSLRPLPSPHGADGFRKPSLHSFLRSRAGDSSRLIGSSPNYKPPTTDYRLPLLTPLPTSLTKRSSRKSFSYHSYVKHPGVGVVTRSATPHADLKVGTYMRRSVLVRLGDKC